jgi:hypothetical protein
VERRRAMRPRRVSRVRRLGPRLVRARWRLARVVGPRRSVLRRVALAVAALAVVVIPLRVLASDDPPRQPACQGAGCHAKVVSALRWTVPLPGTGIWSAGPGSGESGNEGTVPAVGQAYVAAGGDLAVLGTGLIVTGYRLADGKQLWQTTLTAAAGASVISVRAWPGVVTVGLTAPGGDSRTEVVIDAATGRALRHYPAAMFGGAVAASASTTVVVGSATVTSYDNATGRVRWRHPITAGESWQVGGQLLYLAQPPSGSSSSVTALKIINLSTGSERMLSPPLDRPFSGTLAMAAGGVLLFASADGVTAYSGLTGATLWSVPLAVAEGTDPDAGLVYLAADDGTLTGVDPQTGAVRARVPSALLQGTAGVYAVRNGVAFGLDSGSNGAAWGYSVAARRVTWNAAGLPWPHFFSDLSGLGGSAAVSGDAVIITICPHLAAAALICADPELVAFNL